MKKIPKKSVSKARLKSIKASIERYLKDTGYDQSKPLTGNKLKLGDSVAFTPKYIKWHTSKCFDLYSVEGKIQDSSLSELAVFLGHLAGFKAVGKVVAFGAQEYKTKNNKSCLIDQKCVRVEFESELGTGSGYYGESDLKKQRGSK